MFLWLAPESSLWASITPGSMKKIPALLLCLGLIWACQHPDIEYADFDTFKVTSTKCSDAFMPDGALNPEFTYLEDNDEPDTKLAKTTGVEVARNLIGNICCNSLVHIAGTYQGHDIDGNPITLSGKIVLPKSGDIKNMILVSHFTIGSNPECPSEAFPLEALLATKGYAVVIADYIGFGVTKSRIHPYMHVESTARAVVDMGLAVKPYLEHIGRKPISNEVILFGYSQGGSTTLGVMKIIQRECWDKLPIMKVYAGAGPYDLAATYDVSLEEDHTGIPCAIPMIVQGVSIGENLGLDMKVFFKSPLLDNYDEWINSKEYTVKQINNLIGFKNVSEILTEEGRNKANPQTAKLYKALMLNSVLNFKPKAPIHMFHNTVDKTVPFVNSQKAEIYFKGQNVSYDFAPYGAHGTGFIHFIIKVTKEL